VNKKMKMALDWWNMEGCTVYLSRFKRHATK